MKLGIREKYGTLGSYDATFHVVGPEKTEFTRTITVHGKENGYVTFPDDFGALAFAKRGAYQWFALIAGKKVISGGFEFVDNPKYSGVHVPSP